MKLDAARTLDRRDFLAKLGLGSGALSLTGVPGLTHPDHTSGTHHQPRAKQLLMIYCTGALSQLETFDYKPELIARDGKPFQGGPKVTFQGENGNLAAPRFAFQPRGECGKMTSDLLPNIGALADEICFIHSMKSKTNTHGSGENVMSTGFRLDGFPVSAPGSPTRLAAHVMISQLTLRFPILAVSHRLPSTTGGPVFCPARFRARRSAALNPSAISYGPLEYPKQPISRPANYCKHSTRSISVDSKMMMS